MPEKPQRRACAGDRRRAPLMVDVVVGQGSGCLPEAPEGVRFLIRFGVVGA